MMDLPTESFLCGVCHKNLRQPRTLLCGHVFCLPCLKQIKLHSRSLPCPLCRKPTKLPANMDVEDIGELVIIKNLQKHVAEHKAKTSTCTSGACAGGCDTNSPPELTHFCHQCREKYCQGCTERHRIHPFLKDHVLEGLDNLVFCAFHSTEIACAFCGTCLKKTCSKCVFGSHGNHEIESLEKATASINADVEATLSAKDDYVVDSESVSKLKHTVELLNEETHKVIVSVRKKMKTLQTNLTVIKTDRAKSTMEFDADISKVTMESERQLSMLKSLEKIKAGDIGVAKELLLEGGLTKLPDISIKMPRLGRTLKEFASFLNVTAESFESSMTSLINWLPDTENSSEHICDVSRRSQIKRCAADGSGGEDVSNQMSGTKRKSFIKTEPENSEQDLSILPVGYANPIVKVRKLDHQAVDVDVLVAHITSKVKEFQDTEQLINGSEIDLPHSPPISIKTEVDEALEMNLDSNCMLSSSMSPTDSSCKSSTMSTTDSKCRSSTEATKVSSSKNSGAPITVDSNSKNNSAEATTDSICRLSGTPVTTNSSSLNISTPVITNSSCNNISTTVTTNPSCNNISTTVTTNPSCNNISTAVTTDSSCNNISTAVTTNSSCNNSSTAVTTSSSCNNISTAVTTDPDSSSHASDADISAHVELKFGFGVDKITCKSFCLDEKEKCVVLRTDKKETLIVVCPYSNAERNAIVLHNRVIAASKILGSGDIDVHLDAGICVDMNKVKYVCPVRKHVGNKLCLLITDIDGTNETLQEVDFNKSGQIESICYLPTSDRYALVHDKWGVFVSATDFSITGLVDLTPQPQKIVIPIHLSNGGYMSSTVIKIDSGSSEGGTYLDNVNFPESGGARNMYVLAAAFIKGQAYVFSVSGSGVNLLKMRHVDQSASEVIKVDISSVASQNSFSEMAQITEARYDSTQHILAVRATYTTGCEQIVIFKCHIA